jgi:glycosyltransferase involved in cell wall biosynthesis
LFFKNINYLKVVYKEAKSYPTRYEQFIWFSKFVPIALHAPDIIHFQWARDLDFYSFFVTKLKFKAVVSLRGAHINYTPVLQPRIGELYKSVFPLVDAFHAVSEAIKVEAQQYGAQEELTTVIHSPIKPIFFENYNPKICSLKKQINIVSVGRFHWKKGYRYALDALSILKSRGVPFTYTIIGPKTYTESILFQLHDLDLVNDVKMVNHLDQDALISYLHKQDVLLLPSLEEGIANVVLEAMALGITVVSTDCGGMAEVVKPKETGWLVPVRQPKAIADAIIEFTETSENNLQRITQNAHEFVKTHFSAENSIQQFLELYESVVGHGS